MLAFLIFAPVMKKRLGLIAVCLGILLYALAFAFGWTSSNVVLLGAFVLVFVGTVAHVLITKHCD